ncbi:hypothetical protein [Methylobacterium durans]|uniref:Uncharacterized protein n=1 Tax=Methylobacterium durans TaxID=2202825 RepID=A0A2U8W496_9HYPH|nr:hypothetical protein [Methylobacterium durans]AWN40887.1 hypothetical protein DK389_10550 [Methylobacterium durans]
MLSLVITAAIAVGAVNVALVAFLADRLTPKAGILAAGELAAVAENAPASAKAAVRPVNENTLAAGARVAA